MRTYVDSVLGGIENLREHWPLLMGLGISVMVLGVLAIIASQTATFAAVLTFGILLLLSGILHLIHAFRARRWGGLFLSMGVGAIYLITGLLLVVQPGLGALALTLLIAGFFLATGVFRIAAALSARFPSRGWLLADGVLSVILGAIIWSQLPAAALWVIGLFVGIEMLFAGWSLVSLALYISHLSRTGEQEIRRAA